MTTLNWKFVKIAESRGSIMFMLCMGDKLICEFSKLINKKKGGHPVQVGTTSSPFEYAIMMEERIKKSGVDIDPPLMADYAKSMNHGRQHDFIKKGQQPTVPVEVISLTDWKRLIKEVKK